jgi:hypothetical protein
VIICPVNCLVGGFEEVRIQILETRAFAFHTIPEAVWPPDVEGQAMVCHGDAGGLEMRHRVQFRHSGGAVSARIVPCGVVVLRECRDSSGRREVAGAP